MWAGHFCRECVGNPIYASHAASRQLGSSKSTLGDGATACAYRRAQRLRPTALVEAAGMAERGCSRTAKCYSISRVTTHIPGTVEVAMRRDLRIRRLIEPEHTLRGDVVPYMFHRAVESIVRNELLWLIRSSSRKNPARQRTSAPPSVLVTETSFRPRVICSTCSSPGMSCRPGSAGRRSCYGPKDFTALARPEGGNKAAKLRAIREALRTAKRVWLATDCDREGQLIGQEILEHYEYPSS